MFNASKLYVNITTILDAIVSTSDRSKKKLLKLEESYFYSLEIDAGEDEKEDSL